MFSKVLRIMNLRSACYRHEFDLFKFNLRHCVHLTYHESSPLHNPKAPPALHILQLHQVKLSWVIDSFALPKQAPWNELFQRKLKKIHPNRNFSFYIFYLPISSFFLVCRSLPQLKFNNLLSSVEAWKIEKAVFSLLVVLNRILIVEQRSSRFYSSTSIFSACFSLVVFYCN